MKPEIRSRLCLLLACLCGSATPALGQDREGEIREMRKLNPRMPAPLSIDDELVTASGIRKLESQHLVLYTDVRNVDDIEQFPQVFDAAVPQWCKILKVAPQKTRSWRMVGVLMGDKSNLPRFKKAGLLPDDLPPFPAGFNRGHEFWVLMQPDLYYTRHLLLHEGTHAFMQWFLGGSGPAWYSEGMAELIGLHAWENNQLKLAFRPTDRRQVPGWGRPKVLRRDREQGKVRTLEDVFGIGAMGFRDVDNYAWSWAACEFLVQHPASQKPFLELTRHCTSFGEDFNSRFRQSLDSVRDQLDRDWLLFVEQLEYGSDVRRGTLSSAKMLAGQPDRIAVYADRGWQMTEISVAKGDRVRIRASGQYQVAKTATETWRSEAGGISIDYYRGRPLGILLCGIVPADAKDAKTSVASLLQPHPVGLDSEILAETDGFLCFRVNDSTASLDDNQGGLIVEIDR